jgi:FkbM family methyltransferase
MNEVFCREDYAADANVQVAVDIGTNIGISALYFLTRNTESHCYLFEPDPANVPKLRQTLAGYESRYVLTQGAVGDVSGEVDFGTERTGRYGGIGLSLDHSIRVHCEHINDVLERVLKRHACIDVMKIDTEGMEVRTVLAIRSDLLARVRTIYIEARPSLALQPELCDQRQRGSVCRLQTRK